MTYTEMLETLKKLTLNERLALIEAVLHLMREELQQREQPPAQNTTSMQTVTSHDGTPIAYDTTGAGPFLIVVNGALSYRKSEGIEELATALAQNFTVLTFDRRGRGESGDTKPYTADREIEDIAALIDNAGGSAYLYGSSSGAALALRAAEKLGPGKVKKLAMYEPPYGAVDEAGFMAERDTISRLVSAGKPGDAVLVFMQNRGTPPDQLDAMKQSPAWNDFVKMGPTLLYDFDVMQDGQVPEAIARKISIPVMILTGEKSPAFMHTTATRLAAIIPGSTHKTLPGQTHQASAEAVVPVLLEFFRQ